MQTLEFLPQYSGIVIFGNGVFAQMERAALDFRKGFRKDRGENFVALRTADFTVAFADFCGSPGTLRADRDGIWIGCRSFRFFVNEFIEFFRIEKYFGKFETERPEVALLFFFAGTFGAEVMGFALTVVKFFYMDGRFIFFTIIAKLLKKKKSL